MHDPLEVVELSPAEIQDAIQAATDFNTYIVSHAYNPRGIQRAIENGVKCIEHGNLVNEATLQLMKVKNIWLSAQVSVYTFTPYGYN